MKQRLFIWLPVAILILVFVVACGRRNNNTDNPEDDYVVKATPSPVPEAAIEPVMVADAVTVDLQYVGFVEWLGLEYRIPGLAVANMPSAAYLFVEFNFFPDTAFAHIGSTGYYMFGNSPMRVIGNMGVLPLANMTEEGRGLILDNEPFLIGIFGAGNNPYLVERVFLSDIDITYGVDPSYFVPRVDMGLAVTVPTEIGSLKTPLTRGNYEVWSGTPVLTMGPNRANMHDPKYLVIDHNFETPITVRYWIGDLFFSIPEGSSGEFTIYEPNRVSIPLADLSGGEGIINNEYFTFVIASGGRRINHMFVTNSNYTFNFTSPGHIGVAFVDETTDITITMDNLSTTKANEFTVSITFESLHGCPLWTEQHTVNENDLTLPHAFVFPVDTSNVGFWTYTIVIEADGEAVHQSSKPFMVIQQPYDYGRRNPDSMMGLMYAGRDGAASQRIGVRHDRVLLFWRYSNIVGGRYNFGSPRVMLDSNSANNIESILAIQPDMVWYGGVGGPGVEITSRLSDTITSALGLPPPESHRDFLLPEFRAAYEDFLNQVLDEFGDDISVIEILNEPDGNFFGHAGGRYTLEEMAEIAAAIMTDSYRIIRAHPKGANLEIQGLSAIAREYFLLEPEGQNRALNLIIEAAGGLPMIDILTPHPYPFGSFTVGDPSQPTADEYLPRLITGAIDFSRRHGFGRDTKGNPGRISIGELGVLGAVHDSPDFMNQRHRMHAAYLMRAFVIARSFAEVEEIIWFLFRNEQPGDDGVNAFDLFAGGLDGRDRYPLPSAMTFAALANMMYGTLPHRVINRIDPTIRHTDLTYDDRNQVIAYSFVSEAQGRTIVTVWLNRNGQSNQATIPASIWADVPGVVAFDMFGRPIDISAEGIVVTEEPIYFKAPLTQLENLVRVVEEAIQ